MFDPSRGHIRFFNRMFYKHLNPLDLEQIFNFFESYAQ
jgi:hypothetical protein